VRLKEITRKRKAVNIQLGIPVSTIDVVYTFTNGNPVGAQVYQFDGGVYLGNVFISQMGLPFQSTLPANGSSDVTFSMRVNFNDIEDTVKNVFTSASSGGFNGQLRVIGNLVTSLGTFPINEAVA